MACGMSHTLFVTSKFHFHFKNNLANNLVYAMGSNEFGQLGLGDPIVGQKYSPVLVEALMDKDPVLVQCGDNHSISLNVRGNCYSWGSNEFGQCGLQGNRETRVYTPR
jgi:alpha-tubulin suppressor-like RCC1 family protein